jgi:hypothetical protein
VNTCTLHIQINTTVVVEKKIQHVQKLASALFDVHNCP